MSHRTHLQLLTKEEFEIVSNLNSEKEIIDYVNNKNNENFDDDEIYLAIKYLGRDILQIDFNDSVEKTISKDIFKKKEINDIAKNYGHQLFKIERKDILNIIEYYQKETLSKFHNKIKELNEILLDETKEIVSGKESYYRIRDVVRYFERLLLYFGERNENKIDIKKSIFNIVEKNNGINVLCDAESLEYEIFNLVSLYNTFDFENNVLIVEGS